MLAQSNIERQSFLTEREGRGNFVHVDLGVGVRVLLIIVIVVGLKRV